MCSLTPLFTIGWHDSAWTNAEVLGNWLDNVWKPYTVSNGQNSKEFLLLHDNLKAHKDASYLEHLKSLNTTAWFLPANQTESAQPLDQGYFAVLKHYYSLAMEEWLTVQTNVDRWEGIEQEKFSAQDRRIQILKWIRVAKSKMAEKQKKDPKLYCYNYFLKCGILATLTGELDDNIKPQSYPNFRVPRERLNLETGEIDEAPRVVNDDGDDHSDNDAESDAESEYAEPEDMIKRHELRSKRVFDFADCIGALPKLTSNEKVASHRKSAKWSSLTLEELKASENLATLKKPALPAIDDQGRMTSWFQQRYIARLHNEEGWVVGVITKMYPAPLKRGSGKGCNCTISFKSGQHEGEGERYVLLKLDQYNDTKELTLDSGAWCVVTPTFPETAELEELNDNESDVEFMV